MEQRRANIVGAGLIGGSISLGLKKAGWKTYISDIDAASCAQAIEQNIADEIGVEPKADVTVVATPVGQVVDVVRELLPHVTGAITDVGSTKADICSAIADPRFVGGHPMAGSEQDGLDGARLDMFAGATWVLTPSEVTDEAAVMAVRSVVTVLDADMMMLPPLIHDRLVAKVSHVPHLASAALMNLADNSSVDHHVLLQLAAGGFRDMTRIAAGRPTIWPDICFSNRTAIVASLNQLIESLTDVRESVQQGDRDGLMTLLEQARKARLNLPIGFDTANSLVEISILISDKPGQIAIVSNLAAENNINIYDLEISHSSEGQRGVMVLLVDDADGAQFEELLAADGYSCRIRSLD